MGISLYHYRCQLVVAKDTHAIRVSDTIKFLHHYLTQSLLTPEDRILHGMNTLACALEDEHTSICDAQLSAITALRD